MSNPYIDMSMFSKPPPNFNKNRTSQCGNFKVPTSPISSNNKPSNRGSPISNTPKPTPYTNSRNYSSQSKSYSSPPKSQGVSRNYSTSAKPRSFQNTPPPNSVRDYKNEPPPNYQPNKSETSSPPDRRYDNLVFNPVGLIRTPLFKPNIPPPNIKAPARSPQQYDMSIMSSGAQNQALAIASFDQGRQNFYMNVGYRYHQAGDFSLPQMSYSSPSPQPLPPNYPPPLQPPLPTGAPPPNLPPPPPPPMSLSPKNSSSLSPGSMQKQSGGTQLRPFNHQKPQLSGNHQMGGYHTRMPPPYVVYNQNYNKHHYNQKRKYEGNEQKKLAKKKKKPLSQVVPQRKDWTLEEAKKALEVEKECNKRARRQGLIIKFPDLELNRDIVTNFHTSIESVHFQQPSTPRYCFVTLSGSADPETVMKQLNQIPFGLGYLCAEFKKDREDELNLKPSDIDPLTLYVGNLAQEITKEDMTKTYPKQKRIDIGYAKKMKYTRYAFVSFYTVDDAIEAYKTTHSSQMYSKSLIVRFRRLHGTVGLPGESRLQNTPRTSVESDTSTTEERENEPNPWDLDISHWGGDEYSSLKYLSDEEEEEDVKFKLNFPMLTQEQIDLPLSPQPRLVKIEERDDEDIENNENLENDSQSSQEIIDQMSPISNNSQIGNSDECNDTTDQQEIQRTIADIKLENIKQIKQEYVETVRTRFRVIPQTVRATGASILIEDSVSDAPEEVARAKENTSCYRNDSQPSENSSDVRSKRDSIPNKNSKSSTSNIQRKSNETAPENIPKMVLPKPIVIKTDKDQPSWKETEINKIQLMSSSTNTQTNTDKQDNYSASIDSNSVNKSNEINTQSSNDQSNDLETAPEETEDEDNFSWMNMEDDYLTKEIKTEQDDFEGDDDSSGDELSINNILKRTRKNFQKVDVNLQ